MSNFLRHLKSNRFLLKPIALLLIVVSLSITTGIILAFSVVRPAEFASPPPDGDIADTLIGNGLPEPEGFSSADRKEKFYTFLIVGLDTGYNTDTIMVGSFDGINNTGNIIGIPRDSKVNVKRSVKKINAAFGAGTLNGGGKEGGIKQLKREIKTIIGFEPDFYIVVDLKAFVKIVDVLGGVDVDVPINMRYDDPAQNLHIDIKKGVQHLDGKNALLFSRYRNGNRGYETISDYQRIKNQQAVIKNITEKLLQPSTILKIPQLAAIVIENIYTDMKLDNAFWFAGQAKNVGGLDVLQTYTMPTNGTSNDSMYYEFLDKQAIVTLVNDTINPYIKDIKESDLDIIR